MRDSYSKYMNICIYEESERENVYAYEKKDEKMIFDYIQKTNYVYVVGC